MKLTVLVAAAASLNGLAAATVKPKLDATSAAQLTSKASVKATPEDIASCVTFMNEVLEQPEVPERAVERAVDHCAISKREDDRNYVCVHFKEGLEDAFADVPPGQTVTSQSFCEITENYMLAIRGASRIPNIGSGPLINFKVAPTCEPAVQKHFEGAESIDSAKVPDLWYGLCMNQDCAHYLPSRTRWCEVQEIPTHSASVCDAARKFASDGVAAMSKPAMTPKDVCGLYEDFVREIGHDVEAYEHIVHCDTSSRVPTLGDKARALQSSRMLNNAGKHQLRDRKGSPIVKNAAAGLSGTAAITTAVLLAALSGV
eukprot:TRINITY_DN23919_c0_g1_i1.p2 TRINITY_DN23919_c0_g1~~TRINITY_DN23919_c0_g1_i1.p2  ORF type:complete len:315 (+),score=75.93 TRINITY_DN23919_c0_g1_i1:78-1022(+)